MCWIQIARLRNWTLEQEANPDEKELSFINNNAQHVLRLIYSHVVLTLSNKVNHFGWQKVFVLLQKSISLIHNSTGYMQKIGAWLIWLLFGKKIFTVKCK